jgi:hypothetical protein
MGIWCKPEQNLCSFKNIDLNSVKFCIPKFQGLLVKLLKFISEILVHVHEEGFQLLFAKFWNTVSFDKFKLITITERIVLAEAHC